ncbi:MAG: aminotransferase class IV [Kineosporiaceae bacterium]|nr:aminotransferase class IV [Kineosporiaceae bacterium]
MASRSRSPEPEPGERRAPRRDPGGSRLRQALQRPHDPLDLDDGGWLGHCRAAALRAAHTRPGGRRPALRARDLPEGLQAYRRVDGSIWSFRPEANAARMQRSGRRLALPELATEDFLAALDLLVATDAAWVPESAPGQERSLLPAPVHVRLRAVPGGASGGDHRVPADRLPGRVVLLRWGQAGLDLVVVGLHPAARGGTGGAKRGGNSRGVLAPMLEAGRHGCDQVCFLDAAENRWVEELGGMNLYFVTRDGRLITPELGTILEGVTRSSILTLAKGLGLTSRSARSISPSGVTAWRAVRSPRSSPVAPRR